MNNYIWIGKIYSDWFREPLSPLERTWRLPVLFAQARQFVQRNFLLRVPSNYYEIENGYIFIRSDWLRLTLQPGVFFALFFIFFKLFSSYKYFKKKSLPEYQELLETWAASVTEISSQDTIELWRLANRILTTDMPYAIRFVYTGVYAFMLEAGLAWFYRLFVSDKPQGYQD